MNKMIDLGKKADSTAQPISSIDKSAQAMNYPEVHIEHDQLPVDGSHLGKKIHATVKLHVKGVSEDEHGKRVHLAVHGIKIHPGMVEGSDEEESGESAAEEMAEDPIKKSSDRMSKIKKEYSQGE